MDKYEQRRRGLAELLQSRCDGKISELARMLACSDSYVSRMLSPEGKSGRKRIGEDMVDRITSAFNLQPGELEKLGGAEVSAGTTDPAQKVVPLKNGSRITPPKLTVVHTQLINEIEARLLDLFRTTDDEGRERILDVAQMAPRSEELATLFTYH